MKKIIFLSLIAVVFYQSAVMSVVCPAGEAYSAIVGKCIPAENMNENIRF